MRHAWPFLALFVLTSLDPVVAKELKISHQWPAEIDARDRAARVFVREVQSRILGITFQIHPQLALKMKAEQQFDALRSGSLEMSVYPLWI